MGCSAVTPMERLTYPGRCGLQSPSCLSPESIIHLFSCQVWYFFCHCDSSALHSATITLAECSKEKRESNSTLRHRQHWPQLCMNVGDQAPNALLLVKTCTKMFRDTSLPEQSQWTWGVKELVRIQNRNFVKDKSKQRQAGHHHKVRLQTRSLLDNLMVKKKQIYLFLF